MVQSKPIGSLLLVLLLTVASALKPREAAHRRELRLGNDTEPLSCKSLKDEDPCLASANDCQWCDQVCLPADRDCPAKDKTEEEKEDDTDVFADKKPPACNSLKEEELCVDSTEDCKWCGETCHPVDKDCPSKEIDTEVENEPDDNGNEKNEREGADNSVLEIEADEEKCNALSSEEDCTAETACIWCAEKLLCRFGDKGCPSNDDAKGNGKENDKDNAELGCKALTTQVNCTAEDSCLWCEDKQGCREADKGCPGKEESVTGDGPDVGMGGGNPCNKLNTTDDCGAVDSCIWCEDKEQCRSNSTGCPGSDDSNNTPEKGAGNKCNKLNTTDDCAAVDSCVWCDDKEQCRSSSTGCPGSDDSNNTPEKGAGNKCKKLDTMDDCVAVDSCVWCDDKEKCRSNSTVCPGSNEGDNDKPSGPACPSLSTAAECLDSESGCFWCAARSKCRKSFADCPGNEGLAAKRPNVCASIRNETECTSTELGEGNATSTCVWCSEKSLCRADTQECPGRGRGNPCLLHASSKACESDAICAWIDSAERCTAARGLGKNRTAADEDDKPSNKPPACPLHTSVDNCTAVTSCRWCPEQDRCQKASKSCPNGSTGQRGNPCPKQDSESNCTSTDGCLWCIGLGECKKAVHDAVCTETEDDSDDVDSSASNSTEKGASMCRLQDAAPECDGHEACQWCETQMRCRPEKANCTTPSKHVGVQLLSNGPEESDEGDSNPQRGGGSYFEIQDQGLGRTDPNAVAVGLAHIYEITESGETIDSSLVDLTLQDFEVKQSIGPFFGDDNIQARKISFEAKIDTVGLIEMDTYIILSNGTITTNGEESWDVVEGDVKFNVIMKDWIFCGDEGSTCDEQNSAYVDVALEIKGKSDSPQGSDISRLLFDLGGNVPLLLSGEVEIDGAVEDIPPGFPRAESAAGQGTKFVFRFPRFSGELEYDPVVPYSSAVITDLNDEVTEDDAQTTAGPTSVPTLSPTATTDAPSPDSNDKNTPVEPPKNDGDNSPSLFLIIGIAVGGLVFCCGFCFVIGKKFSGARSASNPADDESQDKGNQTAEEDDPPNYWEDEGMSKDVEAQDEISKGRGNDDRSGNSFFDDDDDARSAGSGSSGSRSSDRGFD